jgi:succinate dehydrogenase / fumarate reductase flavoprotein subunit
MSKTRDDQEVKNAMSRRGFLKSGGLAAGAAVALAGGAGLLGCSSNSGGSSSTSTGSTTSGNGSPTTYKVITADILYVGGGVGALSGVWEAVKNGRQVTIVDKGPWRAGGATGMNWDIEYVWYAPSPDGSVNLQAYQTMDPAMSSFVTNKQMIQNADLTDTNRSDPQFWVNQGGECFPRRNADGSMQWVEDLPYPYSLMEIQGGFPRHNQDELTGSSSVTVYDRTMVTNAIINNGTCVGVTALNLVTGEFTVFRANVVIMAAGGCGWINGWNTVAAHSMNSPDNTSDLEMGVYRQGARIGDSEFAAYDFISCFPTGISYGFNCGLGADGGNWSYFCDANGVYFLNNPAYDTTQFELNRVYFQTVVAQYMANNPTALGPHGGLFIDLTVPANLANMRICYSRSVPLWLNSFGIDATKQKIEVNFEMYEHGGTPVVDVNMMTDFPGLFCSRGAGVFGEGGGTCQYINQKMGSYALRSALTYLGSAAAQSTIDFTPAVTEFTRLAAIRSNTSASALRPWQVRQQIQQATGTCMGPLRTAAAMTAALTTLANIRANVLPNQVCADQSLVYNTEWKQAIENYNLIDIAELSITASLTRQESRGYYRPDYPNEDNVNWFCMLAGQKVNGALTFTKLTFPAVSWTGVTAVGTASRSARSVTHA